MKRLPPPVPLALVLAGCCNVLAASAQDMQGPAPTVVVTATRVPAAAPAVPAAIDVVEMADVRAQMGVNASEALVQVPGLVALNRQNYAQDLQVSSRGFGARAAFGVRGVRLLADGIPASTPDGQGQAATFNLDAAERIEVLRGPFSALYGNHSGGVIQLFTREGRGRPTAGISLSAGSHGAAKAGVGAQGKPGAIGYVLDASRFRTNGYRSHSAAQREQSFAKFTPDLPAGQRLVLTAGTLRQQDTQDPLGVKWSTFERDPRAGEPDPTDTASPPRTYAERYNTRKSIAHQQVGANYEARAGRAILRGTAFAGERTVVQYQSFSPGFQASPSHSGGVVDFRRAFHGVDLHARRSWDVAGGSATAIAGLAVERAIDDRKGYENFAGTELGVKGRLRRDEEDMSTSADPYLQLEWRNERWTLHSGVRHSQLKVSVRDRFLDNGDDSGDASFSRTTPVVGVSYRATPSVNVYASAARGFEAPTHNEMFYTPEGGFNFGLKSAASNHAELGAKLAHPGGTRLQAAVFRATTRDELVVAASAGGRTSYRNAAGTLREGAELSLYAPLGAHLGLRLSASHLRATYTSAFGLAQAGNRLPGVPRAHGYAELAWASSSRAIDAGMELQASGKLYVEDSNLEKAAPGYAVANARVNAQQQRGRWQFKEFVRLNNLFDRQYVGSVIVGESSKRYYEAAPGRNWMAGASATYSF